MATTSKIFFQFWKSKIDYCRLVIISVPMVEYLESCARLAIHKVKKKNTISSSVPVYILLFFASIDEVFWGHTKEACFFVFGDLPKKNKRNVAFLIQFLVHLIWQALT